MREFAKSEMVACDKPQRCPTSVWLNPDAVRSDMSVFQSMAASIGKPIFEVNRQSGFLLYQNTDMNTSNTPPTFGARLKLARREAKLTQGQLAGKVGMSQSNLSDLENDKYPSSSFTAQLADVLKITGIWLATGRGPMRPSDTAARDERHMREPESAPLYLSSNTQLESVSAVSKTSSDRWPLPDADYRRFTALPPEGRAWALAKFEGGISEAETRYMNHANSA